MLTKKRKKNPRLTRVLSFSIDDGRITSIIVIYANYNQVNIPAKASFCNILDNRGQVIKTNIAKNSLF